MPGGCGLPSDCLLACDLSVIFDELFEVPFELIESASEKFLTNLYPMVGHIPKVPMTSGHPVILQAYCPPPNELAEQEKLHMLCSHFANAVSDPLEQTSPSVWQQWY